MELADQMRPNNDFEDRMKQQWLRECDAKLRSDVVAKHAKGAFAEAGADVGWQDGLGYDTQLLVPDSYSSIYPHWLCAQMDLALGETARAANELQLYNDGVQSFTDWLRRTYPAKAASEMTAGCVVRMADALRPDYNFNAELKQNWLRECDARLRRTVVERSKCGDFDAVGADVAWADGLDEGARLLAPDGYSSIYVHWLCAQMDLAAGSADRATSEMQLYSDAVQEFAAWMRRTYPPMHGAQWRW